MRRSVIVLGITGVLVAGFTGPMGAAPQVQTGASPQEVQKVTIIMTENQFEPTAITLRAGVPVELTLVNKGKQEHDLSVYPAPASAPNDWDEYVTLHSYFENMGEVGVDFPGQGAVAGTRVFEIELEKGKSAVLAFTPTRKGVFEMGSHMPGQYEAGMKGSFVVK